MAKIKAAVIFGGTAREHALSLASAAEVIKNIPRDTYEVICIGITRKGRWLFFPGSPEEIADGTWEQNTDCTSAFISPDPLHRGIITIENGETSVKRIDVVLPILMGKKGGDGTIQGLLDLSGIPYVGSGVLACGSCMDKSHTHMIMDDHNIKTPEWALITQRELGELDKKCTEIADRFGCDLVVKPAKSGSNQGISFVKDMEGFLTAVKVAFSNDNKVIVEKYVHARKLEVAVIGYDNLICSPVGEIIASDKIYDPSDFNVSSGDDLTIPANITPETAKKAKEIATTAFKALGCKGMARVDLFLTDDGELLLNKIGTMPGLKSTSVFPKLMEQLGYDHEDLIDMLLEQAVENSDRNY
ncbi:D-alanine--D-alanine ligase family protein [Ruminococcus flavefaciens]|jgi:D-alanine--D-alanine ligase|uniref:D-alanine--D-alanine ligase family protein n=1 Tax=Ruminococcus flavefaciens TaxID=1265 RepID=UPI0026EDA39D|nr:D-alanine--D-alanine ligase family protein [Ruminococcus flavefaciens]